MSWLWWLLSLSSAAPTPSSSSSPSPSSSSSLSSSDGWWEKVWENYSNPWPTPERWPAVTGGGKHCSNRELKRLRLMILISSRKLWWLNIPLCRPFTICLSWWPPHQGHHLKFRYMYRHTNFTIMFNWPILSLRLTRPWSRFKWSFASWYTATSPMPGQTQSLFLLPPERNEP